MEDSSGQNKGKLTPDQSNGDFLDPLPPITNEELLEFTGLIPTDTTYNEFCAAVALMEKASQPMAKSVTEASSTSQITIMKESPQKRRRKQVCHRNMNDPEIDKERKAWELLKQWASEKLFEPKYIIKGKRHDSPCRWYEDLFQVCKQDPKLPDKLRIGDLHGEAACIGIWLELIYLMRNVAAAKETPGSERLRGWMRSAAALKKYGFNVEVVEEALKHLAFMRMVHACNARDAVQHSVKVKEEHAALVAELKIMEEQAEQLRAKIVAKKEEVAKLQEQVNSAKHDNQKLAYWEKEIDVLEALMEEESSNHAQ